MSAFGETGSIEGKLTDLQKKYYQTDDGKYYGLPFYEAYIGMFYDMDLFEQRSLYFADDNTFTSGKTGDKAKSKGPNGIPGDYDDGLPVTYDDFFKLLDQMILRGVSVPISWPGIAPEYMNMTVAAMALDNEGYEQALANFTLSGNITVIDGDIKSTSGGYEFSTKTKNINMSTSAELAKQPGILYALDFMERLIDNSTYYENSSFSDTNFQIDTQNDFVSSKYENKKVGILLDGTYWENEATSIFESLKGKPGSSKSERNFAFMPYPRKTADYDKKQTYVAVFDSCCFVNGNLKPEKVEVAKLFYQFIHTDAMLNDFTKISSMPRGLQYELSNNTKQGMTNYAKTLWWARENGKILYPNMTHSAYKAYQRNFSTDETLTALVGNPLMETDPLTAFKFTNISVVDLFKGIHANRLDWQADYDQL